MTKDKRLDIQGIRGIAIVSVICFHFKEGLFPSGFIGVDVFFVLSGFLMASILAREPVITFQVLAGFYKRRFKRIVPVYAILLFALFLLVPLLLIARDVKKFQSDAVWAATFATNIHSFSKVTDYFSELFETNLLTHTWSLGVEIQFYIIVPAIVSIQRRIGENHHLNYLIYLIFASFSFQCWSSPNISFNAMPSRIWQFLCGGIAYELISILNKLPTANEYLFLLPHSENEKNSIIIGDETHEEMIEGSSNMTNPFLSKALSCIPSFLTISLLLLSLSPIEILSNQVLRVCAVTITAAIIVLGRVEEMQSVLLNNRVIVYLGDISYIVYLVHWPVYKIWKIYWDFLDFSNTGSFHLLICLAITLLLSVIAHHTIEQFFITSSTKVSVIITGSIYILIVSALLLRVPIRINQSLYAVNGTVADALAWNEKEIISYAIPPFEMIITMREHPIPELFEKKLFRDVWTIQREFRCETDTRIENLSSVYGIKVLVLGNSIAYVATKILHPILEDIPGIKEMRLFAQPRYFHSLEKQLTGMKPDITFLIYDNPGRLNHKISNIKTDKALTDFVEFMKPLSENSKFVVLDEFYPGPLNAGGFVTSLSFRLVMRKPLDKFYSRYVDFISSNSNYFRRLDELPHHFSNIIRHNTSGPLCSERNGECWWYNPKTMHAYFTDSKHLTSDGLQFEKESYREIIDELIQKI